MKKLVEPLIVVDSPSHLVRVLQSWRLWMVGAVIGGLLGWGVYALFPPPYRTRAVVVVDYNIEELWISQLNIQYSFYYMRETRKLDAVAFSDEVMGRVVEQVGEVTVQDLRGKKLMLSYPYEGVWQFWAEDADPDRAELLAKVWAETFFERVRELVTVSPELEALRVELNTFVLENPKADTGHPEIVRLMDEISKISEQIEGISSYVDISLSQTESLPVTRTVDQSAYILAGSVLGVGLFVFLAIFALRSRQKE